MNKNSIRASDKDLFDLTSEHSLLHQELEDVRPVDRMRPMNANNKERGDIRRGEEIKGKGREE